MHNFAERRIELKKEAQVFLHVSQKTEKGGHQKLSPTKTGPYKVIESQPCTVDIKRTYMKHKKIYDDQVALAPRPIDEDEVETTLQWTQKQRLMRKEFLEAEEVRIRNLPNDTGSEEELQK